MIAGVLELQMLTNLARLQEDMTKANGMVGSAMQGIERSVALAKSALGALGIGLGAMGLVHMVKESLEAQDALAKLSQKLNLSVESLVGWQHAGDLAGVDAEGLTKAIKSLSGQMYDANEGLSTAAGYFASLGVSIKGADGHLRNTDQVMLDMAERFSHMKDGTEKTALAFKLFGKAGLDLIPMLNGGRTSIMEMIEEGKRLNPVTAESAAQAEIFNENMLRLSKASKTLGISLLVDVLPHLSQVSEAMAQASKESGNMTAWWVGFGGLMSPIINGVEVLLLGFMNTLDEANLRFLNFFHIGKEDGSIAGLTANIAKRNKEILALVETEQVAAAKKKEIATAGVAIDNKAIAEYAKLLQAAEKYLDALKKEADQLGMTEREKKLYDAGVIALTLHKGKERDVFAASTTALINETDAYKQAVEKAQARSEQRKSESDAIKEFLASEDAARHATAKASDDAVIAAQAELDGFGKMRSQIAEITIARLNDSLQSVVAGSEIEKSIQRQIDKQTELIGIIKNVEQLDANKKAIDEQDRMSKQAAQTLHDDVKNALSAAFRDTKNPIKAFGDALGNQIFVSVTNSLADAMAKKILGDSFVKGIGSLFGLSFAGGGYTGDGARSGGLDGMGGFIAMMHPRETVIDHTRPASNDGGGGQTINVVQNFTVGDVASVALVRQAVAGSERRIASGISRSMQYRGAMA